MGKFNVTDVICMFKKGDLYYTIYKGIVEKSDAHIMGMLITNKELTVSEVMNANPHDMAFSNTLNNLLYVADLLVRHTANMHYSVALNAYSVATNHDGVVMHSCVEDTFLIYSKKNLMIEDDRRFIKYNTESVECPEYEEFDLTRKPLVHIDGVQSALEVYVLAGDVSVIPLDKPEA